MKKLAGAILLLLAGLNGCSDLGTAPPWEEWTEHSFAGYVTFSLPPTATLTSSTSSYYYGRVGGSTWRMTWRYAKYDSAFVFSNSYPGRPDISLNAEKGLFLIGGKAAEFVTCHFSEYTPPSVFYLLWMRETGPRGWRLWITALCWSEGSPDTVMTVLRSARFVDLGDPTSPDPP